MPDVPSLFDDTSSMKANETQWRHKNNIQTLKSYKNTFNDFLFPFLFIH